MSPDSKQKTSGGADGLSEEELAEFKEIFNLVDRDKGGTISKQELKQLMNTLGLRPTMEELDAMLDEIDADGSGEIDFPEFVTVMSRKVQTSHTPDQVKKAFQVFEKGAPSGYVRMDAIEHALTTYGADKVQLNEARALLAQIEPDENGLINYVEFVRAFMQHPPCALQRLRGAASRRRDHHATSSRAHGRAMLCYRLVHSAGGHDDEQLSAGKQFTLPGRCVFKTGPIIMTQAFQISTVQAVEEDGNPMHSSPAAVVAVALGALAAGARAHVAHQPSLRPTSRSHRSPRYTIALKDEPSELERKREAEAMNGGRRDIGQGALLVGTSFYLGGLLGEVDDTELSDALERKRAEVLDEPAPAPIAPPSFVEPPKPPVAAPASAQLPVGLIVATSALTYGAGLLTAKPITSAGRQILGLQSDVAADMAEGAAADVAEASYAAPPAAPLAAPPAAPLAEPRTATLAEPQVATLAEPHAATLAAPLAAPPATPLAAPSAATPQPSSTPPLLERASEPALSVPSISPMTTALTAPPQPPPLPTRPPPLSTASAVRAQPVSTDGRGTLRFILPVPTSPELRRAATAAAAAALVCAVAYGTPMGGAMRLAYSRSSTSLALSAIGAISAASKSVGAAALSSGAAASAVLSPAATLLGLLVDRLISAWALLLVSVVTVSKAVGAIALAVYGPIVPVVASALGAALEAVSAALAALGGVALAGGKASAALGASALSSTGAALEVGAAVARTQLPVVALHARTLLQAASVTLGDGASALGVAAQAAALALGAASKLVYAWALVGANASAVAIAAAWAFLARVGALGLGALAGAAKGAALALADGGVALAALVKAATPTVLAKVGGAASSLSSGAAVGASKGAAVAKAAAGALGALGCSALDGLGVVVETSAGLATRAAAVAVQLALGAVASLKAALLGCLLQMKAVRDSRARMRTRACAHRHGYSRVPDRPNLGAIIASPSVRLANAPARALLRLLPL
jgi:calmodulin